MSDLHGTVVRSTGSWNTVMLQGGELRECKLRGQFRMHGLRTTNPVTVGDHVVVSDETDAEGKGAIIDIKERKNYVIRRSVNLSKEAHIIAANMDQAIVIATIEQPRTSYGFIDRMLCTAEAYGIHSAVVINKADMYSSERAKHLLEEYKSTYASAGYRVFVVSATNGSGLNELKSYLKDKITLVSGHSGVGKSTLINALHPALDLRTGEISDVHEKGKHTTTFAEMFQLPFGGSIIDTPGIKEFGMVDMDKDEVSHYFPEMFAESAKCKFNNCKHLNEPGCAVKTAVLEGRIPESRYSSYISIVDSL